MGTSLDTIRWFPIALVFPAAATSDFLLGAGTAATGAISRTELAEGRARSPWMTLLGAPESSPTPTLIIMLLCSVFMLPTGTGRGIGEGEVDATLVVAVGKTLLLVAAMA